MRRVMRRAPRGYAADRSLVLVSLLLDVLSAWLICCLAVLLLTP